VRSCLHILRFERVPSQQSPHNMVGTTLLLVLPERLPLFLFFPMLTPRNGPHKIVIHLRWLFLVLSSRMDWPSQQPTPKVTLSEHLSPAATNQVLSDLGMSTLISSVILRSPDLPSKNESLTGLFVGIERERPP